MGSGTTGRAGTGTARAPTARRRRGAPRPPAAASVIDELERLCAEELSHLELQRRSAEVLGRAVPFDVAVQASVDPASMLDTSCVPIGVEPDPDRERHMMHLEYTSGDPLSYAEVAASPARAAALRAEVEDLHRVRRYTEVAEPLGITDELRAAFVADGACWGTVTLYRSAAHPAFDPDEVALLSRISATMAAGLRRAFLRAAVDDTSLADPPGSCVVDATGAVVVTTEAAEHWLDTLGGRDRLPAVITALTARLASQPHAHATVVGTAGPLTVHATPAKGIDDAVSLVLERPRPIQLTPVILAAYGLTERERDVTELVLRGQSTRVIARRLGIAEYTVQDHLRAIFAKVGVASRGELTHAIYTRHYVPPAASGTTPGPYGYFLGS